MAFLFVGQLNAQTPENPVDPVLFDKEPVSEPALTQSVCDDIVRLRTSTDPRRPVNDLDPSRITTLNWTADVFPLFTNTPNYLTLVTPYRQIGSAGVASLPTRDRSHSDGWELIHRDFGGVHGLQAPFVTTHPTNTPALILYNRYTGILRTFVARMDSRTDDGYNLVKFDLGLEKNDRSIYFPSTFDGHLIESAPLDIPFRHGILSSMSDIDNQVGKWFYTDFKTTYDPCVCEIKQPSKMYIRAWGRKTEFVELNGNFEGTVANNTTGYQKPLNRYGITTNQVGKFFKVTTNVGTLFDDIKKNIEYRYPAGDTTLAKDKKKALDHLHTFVQNSGGGLLNDALRTVPYLKYASSLFDLFIAGNKAPSTTVISPMVIDASLTLNGKIYADKNFKYIDFNVPGSNMDGVDTEFRPFYNEPLGVINVLKIPEVVEIGHIGNLGFSVDENQMIHTPAYRYKLKEQVKVVLNAASGLYISDLQAQFVSERDVEREITSLSNNSGIIRENYSYNIKVPKDDGTATFSTDLFSCFNDMYADGVAPDHIRLVVHLKELNGTWSGIYIAKFPVKLVEGKHQPTFEKCERITRQVGNDEVRAFCQSKAYQSSRIDTRKKNQVPIAELATKTGDMELTTSPNPANQFLDIGYKAKEGVPVKAYLLDLRGTVVGTPMEVDGTATTGQLRIPTQDITAGMYILVFESGTERTMKKIVISH